MLHLFTMKNTSNNDVEMTDDESDETKSTEKKQPTKDVLFEALGLIESLTVLSEYFSFRFTGFFKQFCRYLESLKNWGWFVLKKILKKIID